MTPIRTLLCTAGILLFAQAAQAQAFFPAGATAFTPQISVVSTGVVSDVQAVVSADRKYVTLTMRPQNATLLALRQFTFQNAPPMGNVGGVGGPGAIGNGGKAGPNGAGGNPDTAIRTSPSDILQHAKNQASILYQSGMIRVSKLNE